MPNFIMLSGPSGSGKSTYATMLSEELWNDKERCAIISTDLIREYLFGDASIQLFPNEVFNEAYRQIEKYLNQGYTVIFDATNLVPKDRKKVLDVVSKCNVDEKMCLYCTTPLQECINRQDKRKRKVPTYVIERQHKKFVIPTLEEGFTSVAEIIFEEKSKTI